MKRLTKTLFFTLLACCTVATLAIAKPASAKNVKIPKKTTTLKMNKELKVQPKAKKTIWYKVKTTSKQHLFVYSAYHVKLTMYTNKGKKVFLDKVDGIFSSYILKQKNTYYVKVQYLQKDSSAELNYVDPFSEVTTTRNCLVGNIFSLGLITTSINNSVAKCTVSNNVAQVKKNCVTLKKAGSCTVTLKIYGRTKKYKITVTEPATTPAPVTTIAPLS